MLAGGPHFCSTDAPSLGSMTNASFMLLFEKRIRLVPSLVMPATSFHIFAELPRSMVWVTLPLRPILCSLGGP